MKAESVFTKLAKLNRWFNHHPERPGDKKRYENLTRANWKQLQREERAHVEHCQALPEVIELELTKACNYRCSHCGTHGSPDLHQKHNHAAPIKTELINQLAEEVFPYLRRVYLVGEGEPLMAPRRLLLHLFRLLDRTSTFVDVSTNASRLDDHLISALLPVLGNISISLDAGTADTYYRIRGSRSFFKVLDIIRELVRLKETMPNDRRLYQIFLNYALRRSNCAELIDFLRMAAELQVDGVYIRQLLVHFPSMQSETLVDKPELLNPLVERAEREAEELGLSVFLPAYIQQDTVTDDSAQPVSNKGDLREETQRSHGLTAPKRVNCCFLWRCMNIRSTGHVFACNAINAPLLGNLKATAFSEMWNGDMLRDMRKRLDTSDPHEACRRCWLREVAYFDAFDASDSTKNFSLKAVRPPNRKKYNTQAFRS